MTASYSSLWWWLGISIQGCGDGQHWTAEITSSLHHICSQPGSGGPICHAGPPRGALRNRASSGSCRRRLCCIKKVGFPRFPQSMRLACLNNSVSWQGSENPYSGQARTVPCTLIMRLAWPGTLSVGTSGEENV